MWILVTIIYSNSFLLHTHSICMMIYCQWIYRCSLLWNRIAQIVEWNRFLRSHFILHRNNCILWAKCLWVDTSCQWQHFIFYFTSFEEFVFVCVLQPTQCVGIASANRNTQKLECYCYIIKLCHFKMKPNSLNIWLLIVVVAVSYFD